MSANQLKYIKFVKQKDCHEEKGKISTGNINSEPSGTKPGEVEKKLNNQLREPNNERFNKHLRFPVQNKSLPAAGGPGMLHQKFGEIGDSNSPNIDNKNTQATTQALLKISLKTLG